VDFYILCANKDVNKYSTEQESNRQLHINRVFNCRNSAALNF